MSDAVYKHIQLTGTSSNSIEDAVNTALARAAKTVHNMRWFEIVETRGQIVDGKANQWQVTIRVGFTLED
jgi:flavin-binding protein dodecin